MKLPLLVEFKPALNTDGPKVYFPEGEWKVESNHKDTTLLLNYSQSSLSLNHGMTFLGGSIVHVSIVDKGTEPSLTIYAHKV